jgi:cyclic pyranopterin phosphate synthase
MSMHNEESRLLPITFIDPLAIDRPTYDSTVPARDSYQRRIDYLRISLTDRCNLRCVYCMPEVGMQFMPKDELLSNEELLRVVNACAQVGFRKIRLTGGEPTLRRDLVSLVAAIKAVPGIEHIAMTTNAIKLAPIAHQLKAAGLDRVNISIDSLDPQRFAQMTRGAKFADVWAGILAAEAAGLTPIKLNMVVVRGLNDHDVIDVAALTLTHDWDIRFIEVMPLSGVADVANDGVVASAELIGRIESEFGPIRDLGMHDADPAHRYRINGARGHLGFISSISEPFCSTCNRMRLTADGRLHLCLLRDNEVDLRGALRSGCGDDELMQIIRHAVYLKPWGHGLPDGVLPTLRGMSTLGG